MKGTWYLIPNELERGQYSLKKIKNKLNGSQFIMLSTIKYLWLRSKLVENNQKSMPNLIWFHISSALEMVQDMFRVYRYFSFDRFWFFFLSLHIIVIWFSNDPNIHHEFHTFLWVLLHNNDLFFDKNGSGMVQTLLLQITCWSAILNIHIFILDKHIYNQFSWDLNMLNGDKRKFEAVYI